MNFTDCPRVCVPVNKPFPSGFRRITSLTKAIAGGHFEIAQVLLSTVPEAEQRRQFRAALHDSVYARDLPAVRYILARFTNIHDELEDSSGEPPLLVAAGRGNVEIVRELLNAGANPFQLAVRGGTPVTEAFLRCRFEVAGVLLAAGPEAERRSQLKLALNIAAWAQNRMSVRYILEHVPDIYDEPEDLRGESPLEVAAIRGDADLLTLILACGPCRLEGPTSTDEERYRLPPLLNAILKGHLDAVQVLLDAGANVRARNDFGVTPLLYACGLDKPHVAKTVRFLIEQGAELDAQAHDGRTPLMVAVEARKYEVIQILLRFGPDLEVRNKAGLDVFDLARGGGDRRVYGLLDGYRRSGLNLRT